MLSGSNLVCQCGVAAWRVREAWCGAMVGRSCGRVVYPRGVATEGGRVRP